MAPFRAITQLFFPLAFLLDFFFSLDSDTKFKGLDTCIKLITICQNLKNLFIIFTKIVSRVCWFLSGARDRFLDGMLNVSVGKIYFTVKVSLKTKNLQM